MSNTLSIVVRESQMPRAHFFLSVSGATVHGNGVVVVNRLVFEIVNPEGKCLRAVSAKRGRQLLMIREIKFSKVFRTRQYFPGMQLAGKRWPAGQKNETGKTNKAKQGSTDY